MNDLVLLERSGAVATITLNRPEAMNALSSALRRQLYDVCQTLMDDDSIGAVVLTGAGERAFTAGLDLKELGESGLGAATDQDPASNPCRAIESLPMPVIGAVNGVAITGGFELALACDLRLGCPNTRFADTHGRVGIIPGWGLSQKLSRLVGLGRAYEISLSGQFIDAATACDWGLINRIVPAGELLGAAQALAADMASVDPAFQRAYKALIRDGYDRNFAEAMALEKATTEAWNAKVDGAEVEARRQAVMARGRALNG
jgi:enoyl-CoA hydratase